MRTVKRLVAPTAIGFAATIIGAMIGNSSLSAPWAGILLGVLASASAILTRIYGVDQWWTGHQQGYRDGQTAHYERGRQAGWMEGVRSGIMTREVIDGLPPEQGPTT